MAHFRIYDENEEISLGIFLSPKPPIEVSKLNGKQRSKSDTSTPFGLKNNYDKDSESCLRSGKKTLHPVRTPLQTLNKNVIKSERTLNKMNNVSDKIRISKVKTPEVFTIYCDSDSNTNDNLNEPKYPLCNYASTPVLKKKVKLGKSCLINFGGKNDLSILDNDLDLHPQCKEEKGSEYKPSIKDTGINNNCDLSTELYIHKFNQDFTEELPSPETIGSPFWPEENFVGILDSSVRLTIDDLMGSTNIGMGGDKFQRSYLFSHSPGSAEKFIDDTDLSAELFSTMSYPEVSLKIDSPQEIPVPWE